MGLCKRGGGGGRPFSWFCPTLTLCHFPKVYSQKQNKEEITEINII